MNAPLDSQDDLRELYRELILDHARTPRHFGKLENATHSAEGINPLCGDKLKLYFAIDDKGHINDARFEGSGCAISVASASLLTDMIIGKTSDDALKFFEALVARLANRPRDDDADPNGIDLGKLIALEGVKEFPSRVKCATLAWHALHSAILRKATPATTE